MFLATPHEASLELVPQLLARIRAARGGSERRVPLPRSGDVCAVVQTAGADAAGCWREAVYGLPELYGDATAGRAAGGQSGLLSDVRDSGAAAAGGGGLDRPRARHRLRLQVRRDRARARNRSANCISSKWTKTFARTDLFTHRHTPEVTEHLDLAASDFVFTTHLLPVARGILSTLYVWLSPARRRGGSRSALPQVLCGAADGADLAGGKAAGIAARGAHEFLRHRICARSRRAAPGGGELSRQSGQGRRGPGRAEYERDAGISRRRRDCDENGGQSCGSVAR